MVKVKDEKGRLNNIKIHRLKEKLGTDAVPTAELELVGTHAILVGDIGMNTLHLPAVFVTHVNIVVLCF